MLDSPIKNECLVLYLYHHTKTKEGWATIINENYPSKRRTGNLLLTKRRISAQLDTAHTNNSQIDSQIPGLRELEVHPAVEETLVLFSEVDDGELRGVLADVDGQTVAEVKWLVGPFAVDSSVVAGSIELAVLVRWSAYYTNDSSMSKSNRRLVVKSLLILTRRGHKNENMYR